MHIAHDVIRFKQPLGHCVRHKKAGLGTDHEFLAREALSESLVQSRRDVSLRTLIAVVERSIDEIDSSANCSQDSLRVGPVGCLVLRAHISAYPKARYQTPLGRSKEIRLPERRKTICITRGPCGRGKTGIH